MSYYHLLGLDQEPFSTSPDPAFFYRSQGHRAALANLLIELRLKRGLSVVLGDIGTGKTTLGRKLINMLKERTGFLFHIILNPAYKTEELFFDALVRRLGIDCPPREELTIVDYWEILERFLYKKGVEENRSIVLIIDEAHKMNPACLEALRVLLNYETNNVKLLQLILLGQMELLPIIKSMPNLNDRISMKCILKPLTLEETKSLIEFRLHEAGYRGRAPLFTPAAVDLIYNFSEGYPRRIALIAHKALRELVMQKRTEVTHSFMRQVIEREEDVGWTQTKILQKSVY